MIAAEAFIEANTIEYCVEPGCGTHYVNTMSWCGTCGAHMCWQHDCGCPVDEVLS